MYSSSRAVVGVYEVLGLEAEAGEVAGEDGRLRVHVEHARHADADVAALLHELGALLLGGGDLELGQRVGHERNVGDAEDGLGGDFDEVRVFLLHLVEVALDLAHLLDVFDGALFAGGEDEALGSRFERDLGLDRRLVIDVDDVRLHIDEGTQALVLAEVATGGLFAGGLVLDVGARFEADKAAYPSVVPETAGFERGSDGSGFAAMLVNNDVGLGFLALKARLDEIDLGFDGGEVVLGATLEEEAAADGGEIGDLRDVEPNVLGQHVAETSHDLFGLPALTLEVNDVGLHEDRTAVAELREALCAEGPIGVIFNRNIKALGGGLQEVAVAGGTLSVEFEVFDAVVLQDDDLDVLTAYVADDIHAVVEVKTGFGVGDGFDQSRVGSDDVLQDVLGISSGADA